MSKTIHMCVSVRGMLNWPKREFNRAMKYTTKSDGTKFASVEEFKNSLYDELAKGHEVIPMGECEGFDYKTGCPGHDSSQEVA